MVKLGILKGWVYSNLGMLIFGYTRGWVYSNLGTLKGWVYSVGGMLGGGTLGGRAEIYIQKLKWLKLILGTC